MFPCRPVTLFRVRGWGEDTPGSERGRNVRKPTVNFCCLFHVKDLTGHEKTRDMRRREKGGCSFRGTGLHGRTYRGLCRGHKRESLSERFRGDPSNKRGRWVHIYVTRVVYRTSTLVWTEGVVLGTVLLSLVPSGVWRSRPCHGHVPRQMPFFH